MCVLKNRSTTVSRQEKAGVLAELAVALPFLIFLFLNVVAFGKALSQYIATVQVARDAAQIGARTIGLESGAPTTCDHNDGSECSGVGQSHYLMHHRARSQVNLVNEALTDVTSTSTYDPTNETVTFTLDGKLRTMFFRLRIPISVTAMQPYLLNSGGIILNTTEQENLKQAWKDGSTTTVQGREVGW